MLLFHNLSMKKTIVLCILATVIVNVLAVAFWGEYFRTLGHPLRWDVSSYEEWDCFYNNCRNINPNP